MHTDRQSDTLTCGHKSTYRGQYIVKKIKTNGANWTLTHDTQGQTRHHQWLRHMPRPMQLIHRSAGAGEAVSHNVTKLNHHGTMTGYNSKTHTKGSATYS